MAQQAFLDRGTTHSFELWLAWLSVFSNVRWHSACDKGKEGKKRADDCVPHRLRVSRGVWQAGSRDTKSLCDVWQSHITSLAGVSDL